MLCPLYNKHDYIPTCLGAGDMRGRDHIEIRKVGFRDYRPFLLDIQLVWQGSLSRYILDYKKLKQQGCVATYMLATT